MNYPVVIGLAVLAILFIMILRKISARKDGYYEDIKENSDELKKEMCKKSVLSGVCPNACEICAWNIINYRERK